MYKTAITPLVLSGGATIDQDTNSSDRLGLLERKPFPSRRGASRSPTFPARRRVQGRSFSPVVRTPSSQEQEIRAFPFVLDAPRVDTIEDNSLALRNKVRTNMQNVRTLQRDPSSEQEH